MLRYSWLLDDAYVYYRYVDNLVLLGRGLVYNEGEYVEGMSSPAWTLFLVLVRPIGVPYWLLIRVVGVLAFAGFWLLLVVFNRRLCPSKPGLPIINFPLLHLSLTYGLLCYFTSGTESPLILLSAAGFAGLLVEPKSRIMQVLVGLATLVRPELLVPTVIAAVWYWLTQRRTPWLILGLCFATNGAWLLFRIYYYADLFPNTFYLKDMAWYTQGLRFVYDTVSPYHTIPILLGFWIVYRYLGRSHPDLRIQRDRTIRWMLLLMALPLTFYAVRIGGDPRHFRYLLVPYVLVVCSVAGVAEYALAALPVVQRRYVPGLAAVVGFVMFASYPHQLLHHPALSPRQQTHTPYLAIYDATFSRSEFTPGFFDTGASDEHWDEKVAYFATDDAPTDYRWSGACRPHYRNWDKFTIHALGLTEPFLARTKMKSDRAAHKLGLMPLARQIRELRAEYGIGRGAFRRAVEDGVAPPWIVANLDVLEAIEKRVYNSHDLWTNLRLALQPAGRVDPKRELEAVGKATK